MGKLFGTDGIRGKAGEYPITPQIAERLGGAIRQVLGTAETMHVLVGRDTRESGAALEDAVVQGLRLAGADVTRLGILPTPALAFTLKNTGADAALMLTASHNPYEDNGMKVFGPKGFKLTDEQEAEMESWILSDQSIGKSLASTQDETDENALLSYAKSALESVKGLDLSGFKIVIDAGNGAAYSIAPKIFRELGAQVIEMSVSPNGKNINQDCGALHAEKAGARVLSEGADLGISFDGDADRVIFTDAQGQVIHGDRVLAMCALALKNSGKLTKDTLVTTVMSNLGLDEALGKEGIRVIRTGVGDRLVLEQMRKDGLSLGGENSGHLIFAEHATTGDGIVAALQVCSMIQKSGKSLTELASVMREYPSRLVNLPVREKVPLSQLTPLRCLIAEADEVFGKKGRQLIRYSGTENKIRILVEHSDKEMVDVWIRKFEQCIQEEIG